jgi:hypothetical protein
MTAALRALIAAVEDGTATGGPDAMAVPRDMRRLIDAVMGDPDDWYDFARAHDGDLNAAVAVVKHLHGADCPWRLLCNGARSAADVNGRSATAPTPARALLLAALRAKLATTAPSGQKGDEG